MLIYPVFFFAFFLSSCKKDSPAVTETTTDGTLTDTGSMISPVNNMTPTMKDSSKSVLTESTKINASVEPKIGSLAGGLTILIQSDADLSFDIERIYIGEDLCFSMTRESNSSLSCITPTKKTPGPYSISFKSSEEKTISVLPKGFTYLALPIISDISPKLGSTAGGTLLTISGSNLSRKDQVYLGSFPCLSIDQKQNGFLTCVTPEGTIGTNHLTIVNEVGDHVKLENAFTYEISLGISSIFPSYVTSAGRTTITINGVNFQNGSDVFIGEDPCIGVTYQSSGALTCVTPAGDVGEKSITVKNPDTSTATLDKAITYTIGNAPSISSVNPNTGPSSGGTVLNLTGSGFLPGATVTIGGAVCKPLTYNSSTSLTCTSSASSFGAKAVVVTNPDNLLFSIAAGFTYLNGNSPNISLISPNSGPITGGTSISISGSGFQAGAIVSLSGLLCQNISVSSNSLITCQTPSSSFGAKTITVVNPDAQSTSLAASFSYNFGAAPTVSSISPSNGPATGGTSLSIQGSNLYVGISVTVGGLNCTNVNIISSNSLTCVSPANGFGAKSIVLTNIDAQTVSIANAFSYNSGMPPSVFFSIPSSGLSVGGTSISISGSGFLNGATVSIGGLSCRNISVVSASLITCQTPAGNYGAKSIIVINPDAQSATLANGFSYIAGLAPVILSVSPSTGSATGSTPLSISGSNFLAGALITVGGTLCSSISVVSSTSVTCTTQGGSYGAKSVIVTNVDSQSFTLANSFTYTGGAAPSLISLSPTSGVLAGSNTLTLFGYNFSSGASITVGGLACPLISFSTTALTCTVPATSAGAKSVSVLNLDGQVSTLANSYTYVAFTPLLSSLLGQEDLAHFGQTIQKIGDLTGDGLAEFAVASPAATVSSASKAGKVMVYTSSGNLLCTITSPNPVANGNFGFSLASGNMDAEAKPELMIGEPGATVSTLPLAGSVYIFSGAQIADCAGANLSTPTSTVGTGSFTAVSPSANSQFGYSLATGLLNNATRYSVIIGEPYAAGAGTSRGQIYVLSEDGNFIFNTAVTPMRSPSSADFANYGFAVTASNMNNSSRDSLIVGEPNSPGASGTQRGRVYIYDSSTGSTNTAPTQLSGSPLSGSATDYARFGFSLSRGSRITNDNREDLIIGEPYLANGGSNRGKVWLYSYPISTFVSSSVNSPNAEDNSLFGYSVGSVADYDGDGFSDFAVGQPNANAGGTLRGRFHIFSGTSNGLILTLTSIENGSHLGTSFAGLGDINNDGLADFVLGEPKTANAGTDRGRAYIYIAQ